MEKTVSGTEKHLIGRIGWLRAAVLGANDGLVSTSSLILGVASSSASHQNILLAGVAGLVAGAMSMAAGEYVSVSTQSDTEKAELAKERRELRQSPELELRELANIYVKRGVEKKTALDVARQLMAKDALAAHAQDELGISKTMLAKPVQAAFASAISFTLGAAAPLAIVVFSPSELVFLTVPIASLLYLAVLGALGAVTGGAGVVRGMARVTMWGALAMAVTAGIGHLVGTAV